MPSPQSSWRSDDERALLSARADQFFGALNRGATDDWEPFLAGLGGATRLAVLTELVIIDLGYRWGKGEKPNVESYIDRFPELGPLDKVPTALIREEHRCRMKAGETVVGLDYRDRFPVQYAELIREDPSFGDGTLAVSHAPANTGPSGVMKSMPVESVVAVSHQYELIRELGRGMFGEVWLAKKNPSGIDKAIKILLQPADRETAKRELRSLELIKNIRHPFLLSTEDFWVSDNRLYVVMELADATLRGRLKQCKEEGLPGIPDDELLIYTSEAAEGLDHLHKNKITHRDVKPDNILILNGHSKVADFGLARQQEQMMASMSFAGTPAYMAPEVWGGEGGPASDQYGLAAAYAELRQGHAPFHFGKGAEVMFAHLEGHFNFNDVLIEPERDVLRKAMSRNPEDRYPTCKAFAQALAAALGRSAGRGTGTITATNRPTTEIKTPGTVTQSISSGLLQTTDLDRQTSPGWQHPVAAPDRTPTGTKPGRRYVLAGIAAVGLVGAAFGVSRYFSEVPTPPPPPTVPPVTPPGPSPVISPPITTPIIETPKPYVPPGTEAEVGATLVTLADGRQVPEWVVANRDGQKVRFRLITPSTSVANAPRPYFISESKMWNGLYRGNAKTERPEPGGVYAPAMHTTANDAAAFAASFDGGRLPTPEEWDHAAGLWDPKGQAGPLRPDGEPRVRLAVPAAVNGEGASRSRNQYDLIDMAGNGREWTSAVLPARGQSLRRVEGSGFSASDLVVLRGRNYTLGTPLTYNAMGYEQSEPQTQLASVASPYTGFRVVLPIPPK